MESNRTGSCRGRSACCSLFSIFLFLLTAGPLAALPLLLGDLDGDNQPTILDLVRLIGHVNGVSPLGSGLQPYGDINEDGLINQADLDLLQNAILGLASLPNPYAAPVVSAPVTATNGSSIVVTGVSRPNRQILIQGGESTVWAVSDGNGRFTATVPLQINRLNNLFLTASNSTFTSGIPQPLPILQDSEPPHLFIDFPSAGQTLATSNTVVAGRVGDMLSGFRGLGVYVRSSPSEDANPNLPISAAGVQFAALAKDPPPGGSPYVFNGKPASVNVGIGNNGTFERLVPLAPGTNTLVVLAVDALGNYTFRTNTVIRQDPTPDQPRLIVLSGDRQATSIHRRLPTPIAVQLTTGAGAPLANQAVLFNVTRSDGRLLPVDGTLPVNPSAVANDITRTFNGVMSIQLLTDNNGVAQAWWAMGGDAGYGNNRVCVTSVGLSNNVYFCASANPAPAHQINIGSGNNQKGETGGPAAEPLRAWVNDGCNGIAGLPVTFRVVQGGGKLLAPGQTG